MLLPAPVQDLINAFSQLPGIGPKTASRLTFFLLKAPDKITRNLANALGSIKENTVYCHECFNITVLGREKCNVCSTSGRDHGMICVVEEVLDVFAIEGTGGFHGIYHVLHGALSPIEGIGPEDIKIRELLHRVESEDINEIILATNPSLEGDATAMYIQGQLADTGVRITRLARGLPIGGDLEYADQGTLLRALEGRQKLD